MAVKKAVKKSKPKAVKKSKQKTASKPKIGKATGIPLVTRDHATKATAAAIRKHTLNAALNASDDLTTSLTDVLSGLVRGGPRPISIESVGMQALGILGKAGAARAAAAAARRYV